jgi:hypothetical protein
VITDLQGRNMQTKHTTDDLELQSMYLNQKVLGAHTITLTLGEELEGSRTGVLKLDPNLCKIDGWGDSRISTKMGFRTVKVEATRMRTWDAAGHGRVMHRVHGEGLEPGQLHLIEFPEAHLWYLVEHLKEEAFVVTLFPAELVMPSSAGIIAARYGVAVREAIKRGDVEEMRMEAERIEDALASPTGTSQRAVHIDPEKVNEVREALGELKDALAKLGG